MKIALTKDQLKLRDEIRGYMAALMSGPLAEELSGEQAEGGGPEYRKALRQMGEDGWIVRSWPKAFGGRDAGPVEQYIFSDEVIRAGFPYPFLSTDGVGPVLAEVASDEIREAIVADILKGQCIIAIGYSEPSAGTDLASLKTKAERKGDKWLINGQKIWTSFGAVAALSCAWRYPGFYGRLLLQSGSFAFTDIGQHRRGPARNCGPLPA